LVRNVIVLSGPVGVGKSEVARTISERFRARRLRTGDLIRASLPAGADRAAQQTAGDRLDRQTAGRWVATALDRLRREDPDVDAAETIIVDSARRIEQVEAIRAAFGSATRVVHVHLTAPDDVLRRRYRLRRRASDPADYDALRAKPPEADIELLAGPADIVIDYSGELPAGDAAVRVAARLGLYSSRRSYVDVIVGGEYGSEGKGHIANFLAPEYDLLVRVGGPNAGHSVLDEKGVKYVHHLLPSGTLVSAARLLIGPGAAVGVAGLLEEINYCEVTPDRLSIDPQVVIITDEHRKTEQAQLVGRIGSTGQGGGAAAAARVMRTAGLARDVPELQPFLRPAAQVLDEAYGSGRRILLEGTQGSALSLYHGDYPYVTSRDTTVSGCLAEAGIPPSRVRKVVMVVRTYPIRVQSPAGGTSGSMAREISWKEISRRSGIPYNELRRAERTSTTNRRRRVSEFDWQLLQRSASLNGPTDIAMTFADYLTVKNRRARRFEQLDSGTIRFVEEVEAVAGAPVSLVSTRFHRRSIIDRRKW
jgi:adenylosuccinate synthase